MKSHVLRPLWIALALVAAVLLVRFLVVPEDFGVHGKSFTYGYYRAGNLEEWRSLPAKYRGRQDCAACHSEISAAQEEAKHQAIQCENCHGPALDHPDEPPVLLIDRSRELCLRCHTLLPYPNSLRGQLPGIDPDEHNPDAGCSECHNPHLPDLEAW